MRRPTCLRVTALAGAAVTALWTRVRVRKRKPGDEIAGDALAYLGLEARAGVHWKANVELTGAAHKAKGTARTRPERFGMIRKREQPREGRAERGSGWGQAQSRPRPAALAAVLRSGFRGRVREGHRPG